MKKRIILSFLTLLLTQTTTFCNQVQLINRTTGKETSIWVERANVDGIIDELQKYFDAPENQDQKQSGLEQIYQAYQTSPLALVPQEMSRILLTLPTLEILRLKKEVKEAQEQKKEILRFFSEICETNIHLRIIASICLSLQIPTEDVLRVLAFAIIYNPTRRTYEIVYPINTPRKASPECHEHDASWV